jgi:hypothetical protein
MGGRALAGSRVLCSHRGGEGGRERGEGAHCGTLGAAATHAMRGVFHKGRRGELGLVRVVQKVLFACRPEPRDV